MKNFIFSFFAILITGCVSSTSTGPIFSMHTAPQADSTIVYFYNTEAGTSGNVCLIVTVDGQEKGCMGSPGYFMTKLSPGEHSFSFRPDSIIDLRVEMRKFTLPVDGGGALYIKSKVITNEDDSKTVLQSNYVNAFGGYTVGWVLVRETEALEELRVLREWR